MIPTYRNSSSPSFPFELNNNNEVHDLSLVSPNYQFDSYSSSQTFFNSNSHDHHQDHTGYYLSEVYQPQPQAEVDNYCSGSGSHDVEKKTKPQSGLKLTLWKKVKSTHEKMKLEEEKQQISSDNSFSNNIAPIRVCSDCHTTKTPLWRSGPKGPKSLCNACGIRQRKARRAMAAAAEAANNGTKLPTGTSTAMKIKVQQKHKITKVDTNHVVPFKKRCKFINSSTSAAGSSSSSSNNDNNNAQKKLCFEDFLIKLSNNLAIQRVFPQDEREAAILLMAISSGLVHG